jgi:hypothetical protein
MSMVAPHGGFHLCATGWQLFNDYLRIECEGVEVETRKAFRAYVNHRRDCPECSNPSEVLGAILEKQEKEEKDAHVQNFTESLQKNRPRKGI